MAYEDLTEVVSELLNMDRFEYLDIIEKGNGAKSLDVTRELLHSRGITDPKEITKENIKVNKRLRRLVDLGVLVSEEGVYNISSLGRLLMISKDELKKNAETMEKFHGFFETHYVDDLPPEFFRQIYKLRNAELTELPVQWVQEVIRSMNKIERKFYNMTEYLHDIPEEFIDRKIAEMKAEKTGKVDVEKGIGKTGKIEIVIIYQFHNYPHLNFSREKELFKKLIDAEAEFRHINLEEGKRPIGIRIVDEKWATFGLARRSDDRLDREQAFIGSNIEFISWCRDLVYHKWSFEAKPLKIDEVIAENE
ncbi:MAG: hypothetical protein HXS54_08765 [Theionarchaea archaeon]|nr:hypothetical protein [Theionarchaea archaeon]